MPHANLIQGFKNFGLNSGQYAPVTMQELVDGSRVGISYIMTWQPPYGDRLHYSIFEGLHGGQIYYMDPNFGHMQWSEAEFLKRWKASPVWVH